nr:hypothetical protein BaRGS_025912 [Batillaria attramentaria]
MVSDGFNEVTTPTRDSCYHWHTSVELKQTSDGPNVLEVRYKTSNLTGASRVEVALEMSDYRIMDHKMIEPDQEKVRFTVNKAGEYKAYVSTDAE